MQKHGSRQYERRYESEKYGIRVAAEVTRDREKKKKKEQEQEEEEEEKEEEKNTSLALRLCKATVMTSNIKPSRSRPRLRPLYYVSVSPELTLSASKRQLDASVPALD